MREVGEGGFEITEPPPQPGKFLMRSGEQRIVKPEFVHHFQRGGMNGVSPEIAKKISVFLKDGDVDAGAGEEIAGHHASRAAA
jgi:hypothetical protein